jgi:outer membrane protein TolC
MTATHKSTRTLLLAAVVALAGCATPLQRQARSEWNELHRAIEAAEQTENSTQDAAAAEDTPRDLAGYLRTAALNNPGLKAAFRRWKAAIERVPQLRALPDPNFTYGYFIESVETRVGPQEQRVGVMQMFPWLSKLRLRGDKAARQARVQMHLFQAQGLQLFYRVRKAYNDYAYLARAIDIVDENLELLRNLEAAVRVRYAAGAAGHPNLIQTQVELGKLEDRLKSLQDLRPAHAARLNAAMGRDVNTPIPWPEGQVKDTPPLAPDELLAALAEENPDLAAARERIRAAEVGTELAKAQSYPDFGLGLTYIETGDRTDADPHENGKDAVLAMFEMTVPLWLEKNRAAVREATAAQHAARQAHADQLHRLSADLRVALYHYDDARRKVNLFRDTLVPKAEQSLTAARAAFTAGEGRFLDVIDAERTLLEFRLQAERALSDQAIRLAELERLAGRSLRNEGR